MKSTLFTSLLVAIPPANAAAILPAQHPLPSPDTQEAKVKVPGHNSAYYTQIAASEQLFGVRELVVYPNPPRLNEHIFLYLDGWITDLLPDLDEATLKVSAACPDYREQEPVRIKDAHRLVVRHDEDYGGPLRSLDNNELLVDWFAFWWSPREEKWDCSVEATARLPDDRILFSFAQNFTLEYPPTSGGEDD